MQWSDSFKAREYARPLGLRPGLAASERALIKPEHQRFNQKYNMIFQPDWNPEYAEITDSKRMQKSRGLVQKGAIGFSAVEWAFMQSSDANLKTTGSGINTPNQGATRWNLGTGPVEGAARWSASPQKAAATLKSIACFYGADLVGICEIDRRYVYSHYYNAQDKTAYPIVFSDEAGYEQYTFPCVLEDKTQVIPQSVRYALVMLFEMDKLGIATAPSLTSQATTRAVYSKMAFTAASVAEFLRGLGCSAIPSINDTAANIPLAIDAGLGEASRNAKLINPLFGSRCRIAKVLFDLPVAVDVPVEFGVTQFCESCALCAEHCPSKTIPFGPRSYAVQGNYSNPAVLQWQMRHDLCRKFWAQSGTNCGICLHVCPYNKGGAKRWWMGTFSGAMPFLNKAVAAAVKKWGQHKRVSPEAVW